jgi:hypothetical protein
MNYQWLLQKKAKYVHSQSNLEDTEDYLDEQNRNALIAWRIKWHSRHPSMPHPWANVGRAPEFFLLYYQRERAKAKQWLAQLYSLRHQTRQRLKVIPFSRGAL